MFLISIPYYIHVAGRLMEKGFDMYEQSFLLEVAKHMLNGLEFGYVDLDSEENPMIWGEHVEVKSLLEMNNPKYGFSIDDLNERIIGYLNGHRFAGEGWQFPLDAKVYEPLPNKELGDTEPTYFFVISEYKMYLIGTNYSCPPDYFLEKVSNLDPSKVFHSRKE